MAKADRSIDPRILESAKREFLAVGFEKASLKAICENAQVTTGALYKRYSGKEDLFRALVAGTVEAMSAVVDEKCALRPEKRSDQALVRAWYMDEAYMLWWFDLLHRYHDGFTLLVRCAEGTSYSNFQHDWVERMTQATYGYYLEARRRGLTDRDIPLEEMHILLTAFWTTIYEPFVHDFTWEQIQAHSALVCHLFNWYQVLGFDPSV